MYNGGACEETPGGASPDAQLAAEICARILEWRDLASRTAVSAWLLKLANLHRADPNALWLYIEQQSGDTTLIAKSFDDRGSASATSRQAAEQATSRSMAAVAAVMPTLAAAMRKTYEAHAPEAVRETSTKCKNPVIVKTGKESISRWPAVGSAIRAKLATESQLGT